jgi:hypothetical protein
MHRRSSSGIRCICAELSHDGLLYVCDRPNDRIQVFKPDGTFVKEKVLYQNRLGDGGRQPGAFYAVHSIATDLKGNLFTTETYHGQRVQKFVYKGLAPITKQDQGVLWPKTAKSPI